LLQSTKQNLEIAVSDAGIQIDESLEQLAKAESLKAETLDPGANVRVERLSQSLKHESSMILSAAANSMD
jgi:hypothetical protein